MTEKEALQRALYDQYPELRVIAAEARIEILEREVLRLRTALERIKAEAGQWSTLPLGRWTYEAARTALTTRLAWDPVDKEWTELPE